MSLYTLTPRPGFERYTIQVGWNPHRTYFATVVDFTADLDKEPASLQLGLIETILDPSEVLEALEPYAVIPADLPAALRTDQASHPATPTGHRTGRRSSRTFSWTPPIAITGSRLLRAELETVEREAGCEFDYAHSIPEGRRYAARRPLIVIGADLVSRARRPLVCRGLVIVASVNPPDDRMWVPAAGAGATYVIVLPTARDWLAHHVLRGLPT